jgi:hypothetical protein
MPKIKKEWGLIFGLYHPYHHKQIFQKYKKNFFFAKGVSIPLPKFSYYLLLLYIIIYYIYIFLLRACI